MNLETSNLVHWLTITLPTLRKKNLPWKGRGQGQITRFRILHPMLYHPLRSYEWRCKTQKMVWFGAVRGHSRSWATPPFDRAHTTSYSTFADFDPPHLHLVPPVEFRGDLWLQKTRLPVLSCGVVCVILRLAVLVKQRLVTDRRTDRQTDTGPWLVPRMHSIAR